MCINELLLLSISIYVGCFTANGLKCYTCDNVLCVGNGCEDESCGDFGPEKETDCGDDVSFCFKRYYKYDGEKYDDHSCANGYDLMGNANTGHQQGL